MIGKMCKSDIFLTIISFCCNRSLFAGKTSLSRCDRLTSFTKVGKVVALSSF